MACSFLSKENEDGQCADFNVCYHHYLQSSQYFRGTIYHPTLPHYFFRTEQHIHHYFLPYLLSFSTNRCEPCVQAGPELSDLADEFEGRISVVGINNESIFDPTKPGDVNQLNKFLDDHREGFRYTIYIDNDTGHAKDSKFGAHMHGHSWAWIGDWKCWKGGGERERERIYCAKEEEPLGSRVCVCLSNDCLLRFRSLSPSLSLCRCQFSKSWLACGLLWAIEPINWALEHEQQH